jgi:AbrB family looped-hinge helix DNA binding protein
MPVTVTTKGQVTIPKAIRDRLGLKPGSRVVFSLDGEGRAVLEAEGVPKASLSARIDRLRGSASPGLSTDEIMALTRGEPS